MTLSVVFPPKNTSVSIRYGVEVNRGSSVTLTCSSDANPPVENYTWFKVNESTPVGSGQQYNITNITSEDGGQYYCEARNKYGAENSTAVSITVKGISLSGISASPCLFCDELTEIPLFTSFLLVVVVLGSLVVVFNSFRWPELCLHCCDNCLCLWSCGTLQFGFNCGQKKKKATQTMQEWNTLDYVNAARSGKSDATQPDAVHQSLNPNTTQPDPVYQNLNPSTVQPDPVYQNLNPNTPQPDAVHQSLNPNTTYTVYQTLNRNST
ncbi:uncharacterized protein LOC143099218 [Alosa pseudoharengus]|uniref:uncharacterized protein LOC143099218 n=1 Tax=Alosa pseudoharengus TaxID=34774 RepID=UPI003F89DCF6